ncbi:MAG: 4-amino-4-deoxychorismate lyase [Cyanobacteria bacterium]|nr:4-amino-4-deoxychorismate lyase [Cyanobacteria bacterium CG_2015-22_32_23]NCQ05859.1 4-amino-4-deoxychorismate lyase [Cyanobacteria bacterium CG_2015-09_32_10]NCQ43172.1 4-amino-4-deoxychorismate lyase [Cyanobacteria bacterium CG_2015-04_32_10]
MFYYNGEFKENNYISLDINDSTWLYGATVFTTLRVYQKSLYHPLTNWQNHCDRLKLSISEFNWIMPSWNQIEEELEHLLQYFSVLRITIFPDGKELIIGRQLPDNLAKKQTEGIKGLVIIDPQIMRSLPLHKTGNYLASYLALNQAKKQDYDEGILTNFDHNWLETSTGNLWGYKEGIWFTPALETGILNGIARQIIIKNAKFPVKINHWTPEFIADLEAVAYSNSVVEIIPFKTIKINQQIKQYNSNHEAYLLLKHCYDILRFS